MKKLLRIAVVLCLAMALGITAFAAPSNTNGSEGGPGVGTVLDNNGNEVATTISEPSVTPSVADAAATIKATNSGVKAENLTVAWVRDIKANIPAGGSVTITFEVPGATADDTVYVLHFENSAWVTVAKCKGNAISAEFTSLSPVALVMEKGEPTVAPKPGDESPKTGEEPVLLAATAVVLLAGAVAVVALKKKEEM